MRCVVVLVSIFLSTSAYGQAPCTAVELGDHALFVEWIAPKKDMNNRSLARKRRLRLQQFDIYWVTVDSKNQVHEILNSGKPVATAARNATTCSLKLPRGEHWITMTATNADGASSYAEAVRYLVN